jgi:pimeloyl-ACP methyl ester carboxylesterase
MPYFEHSKIRVHYEIHEGLVERDVLAIHGNLASNIWWKPVIDELRAGGANKKGRFIAAEWRGCGRTSGIETEADLTSPLSRMTTTLSFAISTPRTWASSPILRAA